MIERTTRIRASHIVAFDGAQHRHLRDGEVVLSGEDIVHVGTHFDGDVDSTIDATGKVVCPGFINTHIHMAGSPLDRSFVEGGGPPELGYDTLIDYLMPRHELLGPDADAACLEYSLAEVLRSGTTTCIEMGDGLGNLPELVQRYGNRIYYAPLYNSAAWYSPDGRTVAYDWDEQSGLDRLEEIAEEIEARDGAEAGLLRGLLAPAQADTCTEELLRRTREHAARLGVPITIHTAQAEWEIANMVERVGTTPVAWLRDIGFLDHNVLLGHAIYLGGTRWTDRPEDDIGIVAESGASVAHAPWVFGRDGIGLDSFHRYQQAGINMTLGTDTVPQNMLQAMRLAAIYSRAMEGGNPKATTAADVFNAATLGGAAALGRNDLGRIAPGAKADLVIFSGTSINMTPLRDPIQNIVFSAETEDVETVIINGRTVLEAGRVVGLGDRAEEVTARVQRTAETMWSGMATVDREGRTIDDLAPPSFRPWEEG
jgi:5-methylthioadenosine/S-adenosylhomocysteine deaminase